MSLDPLLLLLCSSSPLTRTETLATFYAGYFLDLLGERSLGKRHFF